MTPELPSPRDVCALRDEVHSALARSRVPEPETDAELLIGHVIGEDRGRVQALVVIGGEVSAADAATVRELAARRAAREPLQHITGRAPFRSLMLAVGPGVFVPRPETEQVAQFAIDALRAVAAARVTSGTESPNATRAQLSTSSSFSKTMPIATGVPLENGMTVGAPPVPVAPVTPVPPVAPVPPVPPVPPVAPVAPVPPVGPVGPVP